MTLNITLSLPDDKINAKDFAETLHSFLKGHEDYIESSICLNFEEEEVNLVIFKDELREKDLGNNVIDYAIGEVDTLLSK